MTERRAAEAVELRQRLTVLLAVTSGATDAIGYFGLGGAFTSVMTGNLVFLGLSAAHHDAALAGRVGTAVICFVLGCVVGARVAGNHRDGDGVWPPQVQRALLLELGFFVVFAIGWIAAAGRPHDGAQLLLLGCNAVALGIQSSAVQRFGVAGLSTTYLTGTLTMMTIRLASGHPPRAVGHSAALLVGLVGGAALGGVLDLHAARFAPVIQLVCLAVVLVAGARISDTGATRG
jgi:uncharacterized membrane protein YoaK (UPF0700 family)